MRKAWFGLACLGWLAGCGTDAEGVAECRAFERVRCQAAASCGYPGVEECQRFQRDHCLHGVALETVSSQEFDACAREVDRAGRCAAAQGPDTPAASCQEPVAVTSTSSACEVVLSPERASACAFLTGTGGTQPPPSTPPPTASDGGT